MTELSIDTKKRRFRVRLELLGEAEPIEVEITKYNLKNKDSGARLTIEEATASREVARSRVARICGWPKHQPSRKSRSVAEIINVNSCRHDEAGSRH